MPKNKKKAPIISFAIIIVIIIAIPFILDCFIFGNNIKSNLNNSDWSSFLGSYIGAIIGGIATLLAVIFSFNISKKNQMDSEIRENSIIVYYDFILGLTDLKKLYINCMNSSFTNIPSRMYFSTEWIKNIAKISGDIKDIDKMYKLYGDLEMVGAELENKSSLQALKDLDKDLDNERYAKFVIKVSEKVFGTILINSDFTKYTDKDDIELDIKSDLNENFMKIITNLKSTYEKYTD